MGNLAVLSCWAIAKPHYYLPCVPAMASLIGATWVRLARAARGQSREAWVARGILQTQWVVLFVAAMLAPRWGLGWFTLLLGIVVAVMMVCYVAVPARIVGMRTAAPVTARSGRSANLAAAAVTGLFGAIVCAPPYAIARGGILLLGSSALFPLGVALLVIGLMLEAGATGAVKAIKVSAKLLAGRSPQTSGSQPSPGLDGAGPSAAPSSRSG